MTEQRLGEFVYQNNSKILREIEKKAKEFASQKAELLNKDFWNEQQIESVKEDIAFAYKQGMFEAIMNYVNE